MLTVGTIPYGYTYRVLSHYTCKDIACHQVNPPPAHTNLHQAYLPTDRLRSSQRPKNSQPSILCRSIADLIRRHPNIHHGHTEANQHDGSALFGFLILDFGAGYASRRRGWPCICGPLKSADGLGQPYARCTMYGGQWRGAWEMRHCMSLHRHATVRLEVLCDLDPVGWEEEEKHLSGRTCV